MKLKLSRIEFEALFAVIGRITRLSTMSIEDKLVVELMSYIYSKMYAKAVHYKPKYSITLTGAEAMAFWLYFQKNPLPASFVYETNLIDTISNSIHKQAC